MDVPTSAEISSRLLAWFDDAHRDMPWRKTADPYRIFIAEFLLQRTRIATGTPYYERFLRQFPDIAALARASEDEVMRAWEGLGFYRRARNLHAAAKSIVRDHGGMIPSDPQTLAALPGVGPYTAGAVASIAFGVRVPAVDGNAIRVLARLFLLRDDVARAAGRKAVQALAESTVPEARPGAFNQALMDLGATICSPRSPACGRCPLRDLCLAHGAGIQERVPVVARPRKPRAVRVAFGLVTRGERVLLVRRPSGGLLAGLWSLPGGEVPPDEDPERHLLESIRDQAGIRVRISSAWQPVSQTFSHRRWSGAIFRCSSPRGETRRQGVRWLRLCELSSLALVPSHRKALEALRADERWARFERGSH